MIEFNCLFTYRVIIMTMPDDLYVQISKPSDLFYFYADDPLVQALKPEGIQSIRAAERALADAVFDKKNTEDPKMALTLAYSGTLDTLMSKAHPAEPPAEAQGFALG